MIEIVAALTVMTAAGASTADIEAPASGAKAIAVTAMASGIRWRLLAQQR